MPLPSAPILRARTAAALGLAALAATAGATEYGPEAGFGPRNEGYGTVSELPTYGAARTPNAPAARPVALPPAVDLSTPEATPLRRLTPRGEAGEDGSAVRSGTGSAGSVLSALAVVVVLIVVAAKLWRKHGPTLPGGLPREAAEVLGRCRIEPRQSLYLVRLGSRILVIGSSGGELRPIAEITDPVEVDLISGQCRSGGDSSSFGRLFAARSGDAPPADVPEPLPAARVATPPGGRSFAEQRLLDRLRGRPAEEASRAA